MTGSEARSLFLEYFKKHDHRIIRSSSLVPADDPTLLFTNAGMVQFKRTFLDEQKRDYTKATTSQKCVRAGGKHNDLENVGYTARHHTFFEMLGNFSFGDYFKEKAVEFAWDLILNGYGLPEDKLWVSVYKDDDEAYNIWAKNMGVSEDKLVRCGEKDNFWSMGDTGPCGPCSEIHIDRGESFGCGKPGCAVGCECDRYLEIWNLVFMQYNRDESGKMIPLPKPSIDTGMGLERIVSVIQNTPTNYETDLLKPIMVKVEELSGKKIGEKNDIDVSMKVIADHSRAAAFLIGDGVLPANEGRGYVLRRIMRRAIRYGRFIGLTKPFLSDTAGVVFNIMESAYPELAEAAPYITNVISNEEIRFSETLDKGLILLNDTIGEIKAKGDTVIPGNVIFKLYDTFGFPVDIVRDVVKDENLTLDMEEFNSSMDRQREQSRSKTTFTATGEAYKKLSAEGIKTEFVGYDSLVAESKVILAVQGEQDAESVAAGEDVEIVTQSTPFYGESGGQAGDSGVISIENTDLKIDVNNTIKDPTGLIIHKCEVVSGSLKNGDTVKLAVDQGSRKNSACNHTATHILHTALRSVLGDHVKQSGSMVTPDRLRFDFTHFSQVEKDQLQAIEDFVNTRIRQNVPVETIEMDADEAMKSDATALFEEKYGDTVRVVSLADFSKELCGGTHTKRTGDIGLFKITAESSIASGVRRIEALAGANALKYMQNSDSILNSAANLLRDKPDALAMRVEKLLSDFKGLEKEIESLKAKIAAKSVDDITDDIKEINNVKVIAKKVQVDNPSAMRDLADKFKEKIKSGIIVLGAEHNGKVLLTAIVTKDLTSQFKAGDIVKAAAKEVGGGGGGRPDMAQAGGSKPENLDKALDKVFEIVGLTAQEV